MTRKVGRSRNDDPKDEWRSYRPRKRTPKDYETAACILDVNPPGLVQRQKAQYTVACNSKNAEELKEFLLMLGIYYPEEE